MDDTIMFSILDSLSSEEEDVSSGSETEAKKVSPIAISTDEQIIVFDPDLSLGISNWEMNFASTVNLALTGKRYKRIFLELSRVRRATNTGPANLFDSSIKQTNSIKLEVNMQDTINELNEISDKHDFTIKNKFEKLVLDLCGQEKVVNFNETYTVKKICTGSRKIGEGVFGEVFLLSSTESQIVLKIIPIEGDQLVNQEQQKRYSEVFVEMCILQCLNTLKDKVSDSFYTDGFCQMIQMRCLKGKYPDLFLTLWNEYNLKKGSQNDSPVMFHEDQLYITLEMENGGETLENYSFSTAKQSYSILLQVIYILAVAEVALQFEHRDLHWGNILITRTSKQSIKYLINNNEYAIESSGVKATIIDFTLSRIQYRDVDLFSNLSKSSELFEGYGDYQFEIYRNMRNDLNNNWQIFVPKTNVRWIHYLADKCCKGINYRASKKNKVHKSYLKKLQRLQKNLLKYYSAEDIVNNLPLLN